MSCIADNLIKKIKNKTITKRGFLKLYALIIAEIRTRCIIWSKTFRWSYLYD